ncbi:MAG: hypothetical protein NC102_08335 [Clostridium sp.]|nr:hypothetical protein [Clostridium sp.]
MNQFYESKFLMRSQDPSTLRIFDLWTFKSKKSNKRFIVEVENFDHDFLGIKFYWKAVADSKNRYSILTNDYEPRRIVLSCINVMMHYFNKNPFVSFGFVASPDSNPKANCSNKRMRLYRRMMLTYFGPQTFTQRYDSKNELYVLVNNEMLKRGEFTLRMIEEEISVLFVGEFDLSEE